MLGDGLMVGNWGRVVNREEGEGDPSRRCPAVGSCPPPSRGQAFDAGATNRKGRGDEEEGAGGRERRDGSPHPRGHGRGWVPACAGVTKGRGQGGGRGGMGPRIREDTERGWVPAFAGVTKRRGRGEGRGEMGPVPAAPRRGPLPSQGRRRGGKGSRFLPARGTGKRAGLMARPLLGFRWLLG